RSSSKSGSVRTSVLQQLSNSSADSGNHHRSLHHCSSGSDSPPNSLLVTDSTECAKGSPSPDSSSTSSSNSHTPSSASSCGVVTYCHGCQSRASLQVAHPINNDEITILKHEIETLQEELRIADTRVKESERQMQERRAPLNAVSSTSTEASSENVNMGESLVRCYSNLYAAARVDALDALDNLIELKDADELKSKILFSVVVVSRLVVTPLLEYARYLWILYFFPSWVIGSVEFFSCVSVNFNFSVTYMYILI
ncbi:hypothetical protein C0J52_08734, partial [Blattella germanica]